MKRRQFLQRLAQTAGAVATARALASADVLGANDRVRAGLIGCGGRGLFVAKAMREAPGVEFVAVCDVYDKHARAARDWAGPQCQVFGDFRRLLELKDLDAVLIATPDHWHAIPAVLACQAQKDVYVEKPLAYNIAEGRAVLKAGRRHNRIVQVGLQQRSAPHYAEAARIIQSGALGPVTFVRIWNCMNMYPDGIGRKPDGEAPPGVDWDFYLGPAPLVRFNQNRFISTYRWFWDYGGGLVTDFGTHRFDSMHQIMGVDAPGSVRATGGRFGLQDGAETPDFIQVTYQYPKFIMSYEASMLNGHGTGFRTPGKKYYQARGLDDHPHGEAYYGTNGTLVIDRLGFEIFPEAKASRGPGALQSGSPLAGGRMERKDVAAEDATAAHTRNFIDCVRSRQKPAADVEIGHRSSTVAHLGNVAYRTGRTIRWDSEKEQIIGDPEAGQWLRRAAREPWDIL